MYKKISTPKSAYCSSSLSLISNKSPTEQLKYSHNLIMRLASTLWKSSRQYLLKLPRCCSKSLHMRFLLIPFSSSSSLSLMCKYFITLHPFAFIDIIAKNFIRNNFMFIRVYDNIGYINIKGGGINL